MKLFSSELYMYLLTSFKYEITGLNFYKRSWGKVGLMKLTMNKKHSDDLSLALGLDP